MNTTLTLSTPKEGFISITNEVRTIVQNSHVKEGLCVIHCLHTTAGITINENADAAVQHDMLLGLAKAFDDDPRFRHMEGNSAAHLKASVMGSSVSIPIENSQLVLGTWQGIYFCEFDGPRQRKAIVTIIPAHSI